MPCSLKIGSHNLVWSEKEVKSKLTAISEISSKKGKWIKEDLSLVNETWFKRLIWTIFVYHLNLLKPSFFGINLDRSRSILVQLQTQLHSSELKALFEKAVGKFNEVAPDYKLSQTLRLVSCYNQCWNAATNRFENIQFDLQKFKSLLSAHNEQFKLTYNVENDFGVIQKKDLAAGSKVFVRADLHGDLKSLLENLKTLQRDGLLDENFKCKPHAQLVFLGDYADRGDHSLQVIQLLATLKMENPTQVTLIRGNHEYSDINKKYFGKEDADFKNLLAIPAYCDLLTAFYQRMPLDCVISTRGRSEKREYAGFLHGVPELHVDMDTLFNAKGNEAEIVLKKERKFCERFQNLKPNNTTKYTEKQLQLFAAAQRVKHLFEAQILSSPQTTNNWGDIGSKSVMGDPGERKWTIRPEDLKCYLRICSSRHKWKVLFRGHQHNIQHYTIEKEGRKKTIITTLPVGNDIPFYHSRHGGSKADVAYVLTLADKMKDWTKKAYLRDPHASTTKITGSHPIYSAEI